MRGILRSACAAGSLLVVGCGVSPGHLSVSVGERAKLDLVQSASGHTSVRVFVGAPECLATRVSASWNDVAARLRTC
jgi:hypothetical protein